MVLFAQLFPDERIFQTLSGKLSWSHFVELESSGIRVAQYLTELPPKEILERRFHEAIVAARARHPRQREHHRVTLRAREVTR
jgi:hypothetical protein